jgi:two-component system alkaline phosphatase synthesis response regulator PhoP
MAKQKTILIVEDEISVLKALKIKLESAGFKVLLEKNGEDGLTTALKEKPDLILLDLVMPKMDGVTMLRKLRQDKWGKKAKVLILTNLSEGKDVFYLLDKGEKDYLIKADWKIGDVVKRVNNALGSGSL